MFSVLKKQENIIVLHFEDFINKKKVFVSFSVCLSVCRRSMLPINTTQLRSIQCLAYLAIGSNLSIAQVSISLSRRFMMSINKVRKPSVCGGGPYWPCISMICYILVLGIGLHEVIICAMSERRPLFSHSFINYYMTQSCDNLLLLYFEHF